MTCTRLLSLLGILIPLSLPAEAQTTPTCEQSAERAVNGTPSGDDLAKLLSCESERGPAYGAYIRRLASVEDTLALQSPFADASLLRDAAVYDAFQAVAGDPASTAPARVYSLIGLIFHEVGSTALSYREITTIPEAGTCPVASGGSVDLWTIHGAPLATDHRQRTRTLASRLEDDPAAPPSVRSAARCVLAATGGIATDSPSFSTQAIHWNGVELTYVCGRTFRVRNSNFREVPVNYEVEGTGYGGKLIIPGNGHRTGGYSEITFAVPESGPVRFVQNGVVRKRATNGGRSCS